MMRLAVNLGILGLALAIIAFGLSREFVSNDPETVVRGWQIAGVGGGIFLYAVQRWTQ